MYNANITQSANQAASTQTPGSQHITHLQNPSNPSDPYEKYAINFQLPSAIIWQIKFILSGVSSKKSLQSASAEFSQLSEGFGKEFDKYLLKELFESIDIKDASKGAKDKSESIKITLLNQEITRSSLKPEFLSFFSEIMQSTYGQESCKPVEFLQEITKRLKMNAQSQILVTLSMLESTEDEDQLRDLVKLFRQKLSDFHANGKPEQLPEYAAHRILYLFDTIPDLQNDQQLFEAKNLLIATSANRFSQFPPLRSSLHQDISQLNCHGELSSYNILRDGCGLENLEFAHKMIQPWEVLIDIGHNSSYTYDFLSKILSDFKGIDEKTMAITILQLSVNHTGKDDHVSKIVYNTLESNKVGNSNSIKKEPEDKKTQMSWSIDNLARAFREQFTTLNWNKVFESFGEIEDHEVPQKILDSGLDVKQFQTLLQLFNKSKPQNVQFPLQSLLSVDWRCSSFQFTFIKNCMHLYIFKKDKTILFNKLKNKMGTINDLAEIKERGEPSEVIEIWQSIDLVERLVVLSETAGMFTKVRQVFDHPIKQLPEYLLLTLSLAKPSCGNVLLDELLSIVLPVFLGNHVNSSIVLQKLFEQNSSLFIRGICELCKHDQRLMNLSRVLDITQEVKDSLLAIVYCDDYNFAVHLGILAGKRDFLHYDVWIQSRIKDIGTPFVTALIKYIQDMIIIPVNDFVQRNQALATSEPETFELQKNTILERSHLTKDKLLLTIEHLQPLRVSDNDKILRETEIKIRDLVTKSKELFPQHYEPGQNSEAIDAAANEHFQKVFSADDDQVDQRIEELIRTMQQFKESPDVQEQEIYACMLHGLFDEYRFLHRYPPQYLTKIAKLFGAIIKNKLLDRVLQDIALKFVIEAFRRDGRRQTFGIIVIRSFFSILHQFPKFLEDIYQMRANIEATDRQMMEDIARLHQEMVENNQNSAQASRSEISGEGGTHDTSDDQQNYERQIADQINTEEGKNLSDGDSSSILSVNSQRMTQSEAKKQENLSDQKQTPKDKKNAQNQRGSQWQQATQNQLAAKGNQKNQRQQNSMQPQLNQAQNQSQSQVNRPSGQSNSLTPPQLNQAKEFVPSNKGNLAHQNQTTNPDQPKAFVPSGQKGGGMFSQPLTTASSLHDHVNSANLNKQQNMKNQQPGGVYRANNNDAPAAGSSLNIRSAEFQRPLSSFGQADGSKQININSKEFMPASLSPNINQANVNKNLVSQAQIQELLEYKEVIDEKFQKATESGGKIRLAELLEDDQITIENEYIEDEIRKICNHTDRGNFKQKIEDLKKFVIKKPVKFDENGKEIVDEKSANADQHLLWFIHCILTKRLGAQGAALQSIYVEMIRELHNTVQKTNKSASVINQTLSMSALILKKCLLVDEEEFLKLTNVAQGAASQIKGYLCSLGTFIGCLTIAKNEPIMGRFLDLKQILFEGFQTKNRRLAIAFVSRILKECGNSRVFGPRNPWVNTLLQILREIYDFSQMANPSQNKQHNQENIMEIDSLFKSLNILNMNEIKLHGILQNLQSPNNFCEPALRQELNFMHKKKKIVLPPQAQPQPELNDHAQRVTQQNTNQLSSFPGLSTQMSNIGGTQSDPEKFRQSMSQISKCVSVSAELVQILQKFKNFNEQKIRRLVGNAVDNSIVEILPPVVDRSVTIALITTRELVLKDFAYDGDYKRVLKAADLIVQNLAGSLALVTCREPLRMSLTTNLKKIFDQQFRMEGLEVTTGSGVGVVVPQDSEVSLTTKAGSDSQSNVNVQNDGIDFASSISEDQINEFAVQASKENLELGCKLIKKEVIDKALKKVREDQSIISAIENRKQALERNIKLFRDTRIVSQFQELPPQLQPNQNGLTTAQFQVYEDFQFLGESSKADLEAAQQSVGANPSLTSILRLIDQYGLTDVHKQQLQTKIQQMNQSTPTDEEREKLWTYVQRNLETACKNYDSRNPQGVDQIIQVLSLIVSTYTIENFSKKLLTNVFLQLDVRIFNEVELNILLMSKKIISISEWDRQLAIFFKESAAQLPEPELQFFYNFLVTSIKEMQILTKEEVPQLISVIEEKSHDPKIGQFCQYILETLNYSSSIGLGLQVDANTQNLREFFIKWVVMSYVDDKSNQEKQINTLFKDLGSMGIDNDPQLLFSFCKVMVQTSIEKALTFGDGTCQKRPVDRLDFRYIDAFVKLIVVLLKMFQLNKHEFMTKVLEFIGEVLDEDHRVNKTHFNQRPYHRMLMNILTAVNHSDCFNQKTQKLILFSMADLLSNLSPSFYPAFCFAWLELISHKSFLPHFLKLSPNGGIMSIQGTNNQGQSIVESDYFEKRSKIKELIVQVFTFLKNNMVPGVPVPPAIQAFYHASLRVISVIRQDFPDFLSDFHFHFVNCLPEHSIQLRNIILSACPSQIQEPDPFHEDLKIDLLTEIQQNPRILSNYDNYLSLMNLRDDLDNYLRSRNPQIINDICRKMEQSEEIINGRRKINSYVISAVVLYLANQQNNNPNERQRPSRDTFKQIVQRLNDETRLYFLNAIVNELRYPSKHTFDFSCTILSIYAEAGKEIIFEQISQIFLERLQTCGPYPWGLMISFRELIQNPKLEFMKKQYIRDHPVSISKLFNGRLKKFIDFIPINHRQQLQIPRAGALENSATPPPPGPIQQHRN